MDIEKMLTELREAGLALTNSYDSYDRRVGRGTVLALRKALAAFTAEMPGAIGQKLKHYEHLMKTLRLPEAKALFASLEGK